MPTAFETYVNTELPKRLAIATAVINNYARFTGTGKQVEARTATQVLADISGAKLTVAAGVPSGSGAEGDFYWDTTNNKLYVNDNGATSWTEIGAGGGGNTLDQAYDQGGAGAGRQIDIHDDLPILFNADSSLYYVWYMKGEADADYRCRLRATGELEWGPGDGTTDCQLARLSTNILMIGVDDIWRVGSGAAATPSLAFTLDPDTGLYLAATNALGFVVGGTEMWRLLSTGALNAQGGVKKLTGLSAGSGAGDSVRYEQAIKSGDAAGGQLSGTYPSPSVAASHSGTPHTNIPTQTAALNMGSFQIKALAAQTLVSDAARADHPHDGTSGSKKLTVSKSFLFEFPDEDLAVGEFISESAIRIPAASKHGDYVWGTAYARCTVVGAGTNTILFRTSTTLTGARTTRATINLDTAREASGAITLTASDGMYLWVECSVVGGTAPKKVTVQIDAEETVRAS